MAWETLLRWGVAPSGLGMDWTGSQDKPEACPAAPDQALQDAVGLEDGRVQRSTFSCAHSLATLHLAPVGESWRP